MPSTLGRNLNLCFTKFKSPQSPHTLDDPSRPLTTSTTLIKTFNSLYDSNSSSSLSSESNSNSDFEPDFATIYASQRFFFTSPGRSNSIIESLPSIVSTPDLSSSSSSDHSNQYSPTVKNGVAVSTYSPDPYMDFRRSMQEMVEAREMIDDVKANWDYLHELLLCYLALNPKSTHKFIIGAFADLLVSLMPSPSAVDGGHHHRELI